MKNIQIVITGGESIAEELEQLMGKFPKNNNIELFHSYEYSMPEITEIKIEILISAFIAFKYIVNPILSQILKKIGDKLGETIGDDVVKLYNLTKNKIINVLKSINKKTNKQFIRFEIWLAEDNLKITLLLNKDHEIQECIIEEVNENE